MGLGDALQRWWDANNTVFDAIHRLAGTVAGLAFIVMLPLGAINAQFVLHTDIGGLPAPSEASYGALLVVAAIFALAVTVQTVARIRAFVTGILARLVD